MSINSWIDGKVLEILQACGVELPGGNGDTLRSIARSWDTMGTELTEIVHAIDVAIGGVDKQGWHGEARDAFERHWGEQKRVIEDVARNFHQVADGLRAYADEIDKINEEIIDICVEIAEMEVAGAALSFFTGFLSDLVANTAVAARVARIVDLVKLFTSAAEKVAALLERFGALSEEGAAALARVLTKVAEFSAKFLKKGAESFATNFVADSGSMMLNQALNGQPITVGQDLSTAGKEALGTAAFTTGGAALAEGAHLTGAVGRVLGGEGRVGSAVNGSLGNISGGLTADVWNHQDGATIGWDAATNAVTGAVGNAAGDAHFHHMEEHGSLGGENLGDRGKLADAAYKDSFGTGLNTAVYAAGSGIESDFQNLAEDVEKAGE
ncbi:WXG100-like domain-containing protein [Streptomyces glomeratus]|uniref:Outer membrane channel protein CpnT-like N-terminal domain-containing protein n=1 Tax=Streptomyces glomeratus TaxID=284452 RepID=A0ABP6LTS9_9ACTN|nr:WXG100 family type VII secretion target [Streptomyces glomeratus]MCF1506119.1 WXG100 family type VII secretion target [Streptomyces glomeratus]